APDQRRGELSSPIVLQHVPTSLWAATTSAAHLRVENVTEDVAQHVERPHDEEDRNRREEHKVWSLPQVLTAGARDSSPLRSGRYDAKAEETQGGCPKDGGPQLQGAKRHH